MIDEISFGVREISKVDIHIENVERNGFSVFRNVLAENEIEEVKKQLKVIQEEQESALSFGLEEINDTGIVRAPFINSKLFSDLLLSNHIAKKYVDYFLDGEYRLYSQVAAISKPDTQLYQRLWHREINYQHFTSSRVLAIQSLFILDHFNEKSGGTCLLPGSHLFEEFPSREYVENNLVQPELFPGDMVIMNSMVYHRSGTNNSGNSRSLITNTFVRPFIASQFDYTKDFDESKLNEYEKMLFGYRWNNNLSMNQWRQDKFNKKEK